MAAIILTRVFVFSAFSFNKKIQKGTKEKKLNIITGSRVRKILNIPILKIKKRIHVSLQKFFLD